MADKNTYLHQAHKLVPDVLAVITSAFSIGIIACFCNLLTEAPKITLADRIQILILISIAGTMFVAIRSQHRNEMFNDSTIFLNNAISLIEKAKDVLLTPDGTLTNKRVNWVTAARLLTSAEKIAQQISVDAHKTIYVAERDYQRHVFTDFLKINNNPLEASFFCGAPTTTSMQIGEAVYNSSQEPNGGNWIPTRIIAVIYRFSQFPEGYEDPLDTSNNLTSIELERLWLFNQKGVCDYITFRGNFVPIGSNLYQITGDHHQNVSADQITDQMQILSGRMGKLPNTGGSS